MQEVHRLCDVCTGLHHCGSKDLRLCRKLTDLFNLMLGKLVKAADMYKFHTKSQIVLAK